MGIGSWKPIKIIDETPTRDSSTGEPVPGSVTILRTYAEVKLKSASRVVQFDQNLQDKFFEFRFRWQTEITLNGNCKVVYNGVRYTIHDIVRENEKNFYWIMRAEAKTF